MSFMLKDGEKNFIGCFGESSEDQFTFLATNFEEFFVENISRNILSSRCKEGNESLILKSDKMIKILKEEQPGSCTITDYVENTIKFELKFIVGRYPLNFYFLPLKCNSSEIGSLFTAGLMKQLMENSSIIRKLKKAVEAKDLEIEEYKSNGGTLIRESLATEKFDFNEERQLAKLHQHKFTLDPSQLLTESNIPFLCKMIHAESSLDNNVKEKSKPQKEPSKRTTQKKSSHSRFLVVEKKFEYDDGNLSQELDDYTSSEIDQATSKTVIPENSKKPRIAAFNL